MLRRRADAVLVIVVVLAVAALLGGCGQKPAETVRSEPGPPQGIEPKGGGEPIKIGAIFSVTGGAAPLGEPEKLAAEMIAEQLKEAGGLLDREVQIIVKDDKTSETDAVAAAKYLIDEEKVCAIVGPSTTPTTMAIRDICQEAKIPLVSCAAGRAITDPVASYVFAVPQTDVLAVQKIIDYLKAEKITKIAAISMDTDYGKSGFAQLKEQCGPAGIQIVANETFGAKDTDMTAQLTKIKTAAPGALVCWGTGDGPSLITKGMKKLGINVPMLQSHGVANRKYIEGSGDAAEGVMLPAGRLIVWESVPDDHPQKKVLKEFAEAFKAKYQKDADTFAGHAYDAIHIVAEAIKAGNSDERDALRDAIEKTSGFVGTAGVFTYSPEDHNGLTKDAFVWVRIEKGAWKLVE